MANNSLVNENKLKAEIIYDQPVPSGYEGKILSRVIGSGKYEIGDSKAISNSKDMGETILNTFNDIFRRYNNAAANGDVRGQESVERELNNFYSAVSKRFSTQVDSKDSLEKLVAKISAKDEQVDRAVNEVRAINESLLSGDSDKVSTYAKRQSTSKSSFSKKEEKDMDVSRDVEKFIVKEMKERGYEPGSYSIHDDALAKVAKSIILARMDRFRQALGVGNVTTRRNGELISPYQLLEERGINIKHYDFVEDEYGKYIGDGEDNAKERYNTNIKVDTSILNEFIGGKK